jgi:hypothetical protein
MRTLVDYSDPENHITTEHENWTALLDWLQANHGFTVNEINELLMSSSFERPGRCFYIVI